MTAPSPPCRRFGRHEWTRWGLFKEERLPLPMVPLAVEAVPESVAFKAYRHRYCQCGAVEREEWGSGAREIIDPDVDS